MFNKELSFKYPSPPGRIKLESILEAIQKEHQDSKEKKQSNV